MQTQCIWTVRHCRAKHGPTQ